MDNKKENFLFEHPISLLIIAGIIWIAGAVYGLSSKVEGWSPYLVLFIGVALVVVPTVLIINEKDV
jgi:hypothetical protein